ncbi:MAG: AmmeMemoRadiSam system radical SAM enzyme [Lachnospiraceae bacterium]|nr:AmmeMemoRadiSam system radical SAM enzyme [Lachnospiraceae bacterium]
MEAVCQVCIHHCHLQPGQRGVCRARKNVDGQIVCENYGQVTSLGLDPIEKKPLSMFYPGSLILSVGSYGCNLRCAFCQNHEISMTNKEEAAAVYISPQEMSDKALACKPAGNIGVAYTYNEPLVGWEYVRDCARLVRQAGMKNVLVSNGTASPEILDEILPYMDAMNIDLKGFRESYYRELGGDLETVKEFIIRSAAACHVELTTLIVPGENDSEAEMEEEAEWIASVGAEIPLHITRFFPRYRMMDKEATQIAQIHHLVDTAGKYLQNVFAGNC